MAGTGLAGGDGGVGSDEEQARANEGAGWGWAAPRREQLVCWEGVPVRWWEKK